MHTAFQHVYILDFGLNASLYPILKVISSYLVTAVDVSQDGCVLLRPLTDPCILHVAGADDALPLLDLDALPDGQPLFQALTKAFWPGPLSIVAPARDVVPQEVTAGTGFVAVRCPQHAVARRLVEAAKVPLAAPSANRFGHISPTRPEHVLEDVGAHRVGTMWCIYVHFSMC